MIARPRPARARARWLAALLLLLLAVLAVAGCAAGRDSGPPAAPTEQPTHADRSALSSYRSTRAHTETAALVRLRIPAIDVDSALEALGRAPDQTIELPGEPGTAGWWSGGPVPARSDRPSCWVTWTPGPDRRCSSGSTSSPPGTRC